MQTDIKIGQLPLICGEDLTTKNTLLCKLGATGAKLPEAVTDITPYLCVAGEAAGQSGEFLPFEPSRNFRVITKGAGNKGDQLVLADPATPADAGKLRALPAAPGTYRVIAIAEQGFVDGQHAKVRPCPVGNVTVGG